MLLMKCEENNSKKELNHAAQRLHPADAEAFVETCRDSSGRPAIGAMRALIDDVIADGYRVVCTSIVIASGRTLPELAAILRSHALLHTAEGEFFRNALAAASEQCPLPVKRVGSARRGKWRAQSGGLPNRGVRWGHHGDRMKRWPRWPLESRCRRWRDEYTVE
jgi:hypothetical protein